MYVQTTQLRYWKSERSDISTCEDALAEDAGRGLFVVADGAGTTLFAQHWAHLLVQHFLDLPLLSDDPFEIEWWVRQAQEQLKQQIPQSDKLDWNAQQKARNQGSYATLAALRVQEQSGDELQAELLVFGDSCVIIGRAAQQQVESFPLQEAHEFDLAPICIPSLLKNFNPKFHTCKRKQVRLHAGDSVILATDAVARWLVSAGAGRFSTSWEAFQTLLEQRPPDWPAFVDGLRQTHEMVDDDSTALLLTLTNRASRGQPLSSTTQHRRVQVEQRRADFQQALTANNRELIAVYYGDGRDLSQAGVDYPSAERDRSRAVAEALREVMQVFREAINSANPSARVEPVWWRYAELLQNEPCAETLRQSLRSSGVRLQPPPGVEISAQPVVSALPEVPAQPVASPPPSVSPLDEEMTVRLSPEDRERYLHKVRQPEDERRALEQLRLEMQSGKDHDILFSLKQFEENKYDTGVLTQAEQVRLRDVRQREEKRDHLTAVLEEGTVAQKLDALEQLGTIPFTTEAIDQQQLALARSFRQAFRSNNDEQIQSVYNAIEFSPLRKHFQFSQEEQQRIEQARQNNTALHTLRTILASHEVSIHLLHECYQQLPDQARQALTAIEQRFIQTCEQFTKAYTLREDELLATLYNQLRYSPYVLAFSLQECQRVERACQHFSTPSPIVAIVNGDALDVKQFIAFYRVKGYFLQYSASQERQITSGQKSMNVSISVDQWPPADQDAKKNYALTILDELVTSALIRSSLLENSSLAIFNRESSQRRRQELTEQLQRYGEHAIPALRQMDEKQFQQAVEVLVRLELMREHLKQGGMTLEAWRREQRGTILYPEWPEAHSQSTNTEQKRCWVLYWSQLKTLAEETGGTR